MENYHVIQIAKSLTSYKFYHDLLPALHDYVRLPDQKPILFDFTNTTHISPLVIPNLLCVGYVIGGGNYDAAPIVFVPDSGSSDDVRAYLHNIGFVKIAQTYGLFSFTASIDYGPGRQILDPLCATREFNHAPGENGSDESAVRTEVSMCFGNLFKKYLSGFKSDTDNYYNIVENTCAQLIHNSLLHGNSFAFLTAQIDHSASKVYLSISDCGIGFKTSINQQIRGKEEPFKNRTELIPDELTAIVNAIFARAEQGYYEVYGIYPLLKEVLDISGIVRIHSKDTQLILTDRMRTALAVSADNRADIPEIRRSFLSLLHSKFSNGTNIYTNMKFGGAHIEIEIPLTRGEK